MLDPEKMHELLMHYKYTKSVKLLTRGVTHDYNNIFMGLSGQFSISNSEERSIEKVAKREQLVEELLQRGIKDTELLFGFSRKNEKRKGFHSPNRLANKAIELLNLLSRIHKFKLSVHGNLPKIYINDRDILLSIFYLGENAINAMAEGGIIYIDVSSFENRTIAIEMLDQGGGFVTDIIDDGFKPFAKNASKNKSLGLGLYATNSLVTEHGGTLTLCQREEGGTKATIKIPVPEYLDEEGQKALKNEKTKLTTACEVKHTVLIVDDDKAIRAMLLSRLQRSGHIVFCVESCAEAVEEFGYLSDIITIVLMDIGLRDSSGITCVEKLSAISDKHVVIYMSGERFEDSWELDDDTIILKKPFTMKQLEQVISNVQI